MGESSLDDLFGESDQDHNHRDPESRGHRGPRKGKLLRMLPVLLVFVVVLALGAGGYFGYSWVTHNVNVEKESDDFDGEGSGEVVVQVADGDSGSDIASTLVDKGVIKSKTPFVNAFSAHPDASKITPGTYRLRSKMSSTSALDLLLDPASNAGIRVTIPEGVSSTQIYERLSNKTSIPVKDFEKAGKDYKALGVPENRARSVEGYLWPGTYDFQEDQSAKEILTTMVSRMTSTLEKKGIPENKWHETLTYASIAEKEARKEEDYGKVVRTLKNRLAGVGEAGGSPMPLQLDSTVAYVHGLKTISTTPKQRAVDSPYNTYKNPGLPIGPISNPGAATIDAAAKPPEGKWLYWVTVNTESGETKFSETKSQHDKAVQEWREWAKSR